MKRIVSHAKLHDLNVVIPGLGSLNMTTLPPVNKTFKSFSMHFSELGLTVEINGIESLIPAANVQFVSFAPEEVKKTK